MTDEVRPTFLLGVGAMKAGTTWLHDHLAASPQCVTSYRKELHVLDAVDLPSERWMRDRIGRRAAKAAAAVLAGEPADAADLHRAALVADVSLYPDYFAGLLTGGRRLTLDITPSYAQLGAERLRWVRDSFAERRVRAVAVFLMRDPVDRIWSHVRMVQERRPESYPRSSEEHVRELYADPTYEGRTRYETTLAALDDSFAPADRYLGFYETLFTDEAVADVSRLAGIDLHAGRFDVRVNPSAVSAPLSEETERLVAEHYRTTYDAVARARPDVDLRSVWPSSRWVL